MSKKTQTLTNMDLGTRMKTYEAAYENVIPNDEHIIVRIDGKKFSKFTKVFKKPFDKILADTMVEVTELLVEEYKASTGYTQSDEITLIIPSYKNLIVDNRRTKSSKKKHKIEVKETKEWEHNLGGRTQKLVSEIAGFTTIQFNRILFEKIEEEQLNNQTIYTQKELIEMKLRIFQAYFDARTYGVTCEEEAFNSLLWRMQDAEKNSRSNAAYAYLSHKSLLQKDGEERVRMLLEQTGIDWNTYPNMFKYGVMIKKERYTKPCEDGTSCIRTRMVRMSEKLSYSTQNVQMVMAKFIDSTKPIL